jgi:hypothetical protein
MGLFEKIFGKKEPVAAAKAKTTFQLLEGYTPAFYNWNGSIYESDLRNAKGFIVERSSGYIASFDEYGNVKMEKY